MEGQFTLKQHHKFLTTLITEARKQNRDTFRISLRQTAQIYDFTNLLKDEEEMEFVLEDLMMELAEMELVGRDGTLLDSCGVLRLDYPGGRRDLEVEVDPRLKTVGEFRFRAESEGDT